MPSRRDMMQSLFGACRGLWRKVISRRGAVVVVTGGSVLALTAGYALIGDDDVPLQVQVDDVPVQASGLGGAAFSFRGNGPGAAGVLLEDGDGWTLRLDVKEPPTHTYSSYAALSLSELDGRCLLSFTPPDNFHRVDVVLGGKSVGWTKASRSYGKTRSFVSFSPVPGKYYEAVFYYGGKVPDSLEFRDLTLECVPMERLPLSPMAQGMWVDLEELITTTLVDVQTRRQEERKIRNYGELVGHFSSAAVSLRRLIADGADEAEITRFLEVDFSAIRDFLVSEPTVGERRRLAATYATYLAHFSVYLGRTGGIDPLAILAQGNGTCNQQAISARYIGNLLENGLFQEKLLGTDVLNMGHTVAVGDAFFADVTNNIVVFVSPQEWNRMDAMARLRILDTRAVFGVSRDVHAETLSPESYALFAAEGKPGIGRQNYIDSLRLWPRAHIPTG